MKGFFKLGVVCLQIWVALTLLAKLGGGSIYRMALQQPSPQKKQWCFGSQGGPFTGVNWWVMVILLEGV